MADLRLVQSAHFAPEPSPVYPKTASAETGMDPSQPRTLNGQAPTTRLGREATPDRPRDSQINPQCDPPSDWQSDPQCNAGKKTMKHAASIVALTIAALIVVFAGDPVLAAAESRLISASSTHSDSYPAECALDGDGQTRWASGNFREGPEWVCIDFGRPVPVDNVVLHWERAHATEYRLEVSDDGRQWQTLREARDSKGGKEVLSGLSGRGRYLRLSCLKPAEFGIVSLWEIELPDAEPRRAIAEARRQAAEARREAELHVAAEGGIQEIIFAVRTVMQEHWYANFGYFSPDGERTCYGKGGRLCKLNLKTGKLTVLVNDPEGAVRDPCVHYDGRRIVFSYRKGGSETYHLYEIQADGGGLRQLTEGIYDDIEPCWLPDGGIVFASARSRRWVQCWLTQVANLHRCDADGKNVRQLSANLEHDNTPWVLPDGRILYMRWEYVDRSQVHYHHLWTMNPDGTGQTVFFGNLYPGDVYIDAKPIPGSDRVVMIKSPGHGATEHAGFVATVGVKQGPDHLPSLQTKSGSADFRDPWALTEGLFLAARRNALVLVDPKGTADTIYTLPSAFGDAWLHEPRPLVARDREPVIPPHVNLAQPTGRFLLNNVYAGRNMAGVRPGEIKKLLVIESLPKPVNFTGGMDPLSYVGTFTLERILGTVPVEADGSAFLEVPALRSLLFVALDENDLAVKRMQSFATVLPGETQGCVGCHTQRSVTPPASKPQLPLAARRSPSLIAAIPGAPDIPDFPRDLQPVLDRYCLKCHDYDKRDGGVILTGDRGPMFSHSYYTLVDPEAGGRRPQLRPKQLPAARARQRRQRVHEDVGAFALRGAGVGPGSADGASLARRGGSLPGNLRRAGHRHDRRLPDEPAGSGERRRLARDAGCPAGLQPSLWILPQRPTAAHPAIAVGRDRAELLGPRHERSTAETEPAHRLQPHAAREVADSAGTFG